MIQLTTFAPDIACKTFFDSVFGALNWAKYHATSLADPTLVYTSESLLFINFDKWKEEFQAFLTTPEYVTAFTRLYPTHVHLFDVAQAFCDSCDRIHAVLDDLRSHHANPTRTDVINYHDEFDRNAWMTVDEHAQMHGLTAPQYLAWEAQATPRGLLYLSQTERDTLRMAIEAEFESPL